LGNSETKHNGGVAEQGGFGRAGRGRRGTFVKEDPSKMRTAEEAIEGGELRSRERGADLRKREGVRKR